MKKRIVLVLAAVLFSILASALLGRLALPGTHFGHMVKQMSHGDSSAVSQTSGGDGSLWEATLHMIRVTTFVLDPVVALCTGFLIALFRDKKSPILAALGILPLAAFSVFTYPVFWVGAVAGFIDLLIASGAAAVTSRVARGRASSAFAMTH